MKVIERIAYSLIRQMVLLTSHSLGFPRERHNRCNLCCPLAAGEVSYGRQTY